MIVREKAGHISDAVWCDKEVDWLDLEWYESGKRILHKKSRNGQEVAIKFLKEAPDWKEGDVVYGTTDFVVAIHIIPCDSLVIRPAAIYEAASLCYEIGNKHLPLFYESGELLTPYDSQLFHLLTAQGYMISRQERKLIHPLKTTVSPHADSDGNSLFSRIMKLTNNAD